MFLAHLQPGERQLPIAGWDGYFVTDLGRVFSYKRQGFQSSRVELELAPSPLNPIYTEQGGYRTLAVMLKQGREKRRRAIIAHLVLAAFVGPRPRGMLVLHRDDDPTNNNLSNLRYGTPSQNVQDAKRNGKRLRRETHRVTPALAQQILQCRAQGMTFDGIAALTKVSRSWICRIVAAARDAKTERP